MALLLSTQPKPPPKPSPATNPTSRFCKGRLPRRPFSFCNVGFQPVSFLRGLSFCNILTRHMSFFAIWMIGAGLVGLVLPVPGFVVAWLQWHRSMDASVRWKTHFMTLVGLLAASIGLLSWILSLLCIYRYKSLPFAVCNSNYPSRCCFIFSLVAIVAGAFGTRSCRWPTIVSAIGMLLYSLSIGSIVY